jgi:hypothetical protein
MAQVFATAMCQNFHVWNDVVRYNPKRLAETLTTENEESCTTYNMLKVIDLALHDRQTELLFQEPLC